MLELTEVADAEPGEGEVLLTVTGCGICGSDLHLAAQVAPEGAVLGHEIAGVVAAHGRGVDATALPLGTPVAPRPLIGCGACRWCQAGRPDHCASFQLVGLERPGGFAEAVAVRADECWILPSSLPAADHALVEPFAIARRVARRASLEAGDKVAILGAGPIGLTVAAWARALNAGAVVATDPEEDRRSLALAVGADAVVDPRGAVGQEVAEALGGPPDVVFECTGHAGLIGQALELVAVDGRVAVVGICLQNDAIFPWWGISKEADVRFSVYYGREDYTETIDAFATGRLNPSALVTESLGLEGLPARFSALAAHAEGGKVLVRP